MDALDAILSRRSIRAYTDEPVSAELIATLLHAAMAAPSAGNQQPWRFVATTGGAQLDAMAETTPYGRMLKQAPLAITVCAADRRPQAPDDVAASCSAAVENILVAANGLGLGACWLGFWPKMERVTPLKAVLELPEGSSR